MDLIAGLEAQSALFTDATLKAACKTQTQTVFPEKGGTFDAYEPFSGAFECSDNSILTGIQICIEVRLKYVAVECTPVEDGFSLGKTVTVQNSKEEPKLASCPDKYAATSIALKQIDSTIITRITCTAIS